MKYQDYKYYFFIGIGGIGMSSLAKYLAIKNKNIAGYDREKTELTCNLEKIGIDILYDFDINNIEKSFKNPTKTLVIYTPAISNDNLLFKFFKDLHFTIIKRSDLLASIVNNNFSIAIAGTHGKTTITAILSHILSTSNLNYTAFIGGISNENNSNLKCLGDEIFIVEADEYDRTFLKLKPNIICINNIDGDHFDIYDDYNDLKTSFVQFSKNLRDEGILISNDELDFESINYGFKDDSNFVIKNLRTEAGQSIFDIDTNDIKYNNIHFNMLGKYNCINALAAIIISLKMNISFDLIKKSLKTFKGVKRRLSFELTKPKILIDDYAHHPKEVTESILAVKKMYPNRHITVIFQPHLYSRTNDFSDEFARALSLSDSLIILEIYAAREKSIEGVSSEMLLNKCTVDDKKLSKLSAVVDCIEDKDIDVLLTLGAGDISTIVNPIKSILS